MHSPTTAVRAIAAAASLFISASTAMAQAAIPSPDATDPVRLEVMQGFPPLADKVVRLGTLLKFPNGRWGFHHLRELGPTVQVWRGDERPSTLRESV